jgi:hypothetical protein
MANGLFDYFGNMNIFGAAPGGQVQSLLDNKLITKEAVERANKQSIGSGLITGLASYLAQPKNQGYGDSTPYLAKAFLNANQAAQVPFTNLPNQYAMDTQIAEDKLNLENQKRTKELENQLLNDPRVKDNAILRAAVFSNPEKVFEILNKPKPVAEFKAFSQQDDLYKINPDGTEDLVRKGITKPTTKTSYTNTPTELFVDGQVVNAMLPTAEGFKQGLKPIDVSTGAPIVSNYTVKPKPLTDSQGENKQHSTKMGASNAIFSNQLENEDGTLNYDPQKVNMQEVVSNYYLIGDASAALLNKYNLSPQDRQASQAKKIFINSILRKESGAAIAQSEFDNADRQYFPQFGDDAQTIINKRKTRDLVTKTMAAAVMGDQKAEQEIQEIIADLSMYKPSKRKKRTQDEQDLLDKYLG